LFRGFFGAILLWLRDPIWMGGLIVQAAGYALYVLSLSNAEVSMVAVMQQGGIAFFVARLCSRRDDHRLGQVYRQNFGCSRLCRAVVKHRRSQQAAQQHH
jgi:hypothetical protein